MEDGGALCCTVRDICQFRLILLSQPFHSLLSDERKLKTKAGELNLENLGNRFNRNIFKN
jgi:hypothetical protein